MQARNSKGNTMEKAMTSKNNLKALTLQIMLQEDLTVIERAKMEQALVLRQWVLGRH